MDYLHAYLMIPDSPTTWAAWMATLSMTSPVGENKSARWSRTHHGVPGRPRARYDSPTSTRAARKPVRHSPGRATRTNGLPHDSVGCQDAHASGVNTYEPRISTLVRTHAATLTAAFQEGRAYGSHAEDSLTLTTACQEARGRRGVQ